jgi:uncharacterized membrane protein YuzA (DUF378 family)
MAEKTMLDKIVAWLLIIGGINWGLDALNWNLVDAIFNGWAPVLATIIYIVVGLAGLYGLYAMFAKKK